MTVANNSASSRTGAALDSVKESLQRGQSVLDVASTAGASVSDLLIQLKAKALAASDTGLDTAGRSALNEDFKALRDQITKVVSNAEFNGVNLLDGTKANIQALANADGSSHLTVAAQTLSLGGSIVTLATTETIGTATHAASVLTTITSSIAAVSTALAKIGTGSKSLESHLTFVGKLQDTIDAGIGNLVDADLAKESARLQALQTKQQLGVQALSIANSSTSSLLGLFR